VKHPSPAPRPPSRPADTTVREALLTLATLWLAILALALPSSAHTSDEARVLGHLNEVPVWILSAGRDHGGPQAAVLTVGGTMWWVAEGGRVRLHGGLGGEQAEACGGAILAVDVLGRLQRFAQAPSQPIATLTGPPVSLHHRPVCLDALHPDGGLPAGAFVVVGADGDVLLLERDARERGRAAGVRALPDAEPRILDLGGATGPVVAVLADPTQRYRHGVLGDEVEAASVVLLSIPSLREVARWSPPLPQVIEERRTTPWRSGDTAGVHVVVSDDRTGARLVTLEWDGSDLVRVAEGAPMGPSRWLHVLAAVGTRVYVQHRPHLRGPIVRYDVGASVGGAGAVGAAPGDPSRIESTLDVSSHVIGERNLDRALWIGSPATGVDLLALPRGDARSVSWLRCDARACRVVHETTLPAPLVTNLAIVGPAGAPEGLLAGGADGSVWWIPLPRALGR
jgi:hypothetical protein